MRSAHDNPSVVDNYIEKELVRGSLAGPFPEDFVKGLHFNRFGLIPKPIPGQWRMIVDLSFPKNYSVNDFIADSEASVQYSSVDDAIDIIMQIGRGALLAKFDIKSAYRILPIHSEDRFLFGMRWKGKIFIDLCLAFGLRSACKILIDFADMLEWVLKFRTPIQFLSHYLGDFLLAGPTSSTTAVTT